MDITLRAVVPDDLPIFFAHQQDREACWMAAFTAPDPDDRDAFNRHWQRNMSRDTVTIRTITVDGQVAGHVASFVDDGDLEVTYWIGRDFWGQGLAARALALFLAEMTERPVYARAATDNIGSLRVLEKCGFRHVATGSGFANARGQETEELILRLDLT